MQHPLWQEEKSVVYNCCWSSSAHSFSGPWPHFNISDSRFPQTWRTRSPHLSPRNKVGRLYPQALGYFSLPPTISRTRVEVFNPASTVPLVLVMLPRAGRSRKQRVIDVLYQPLRSNGEMSSCNLATAVSFSDIKILRKEKKHEGRYWQKQSENEWSKRIK
jgi:hypothetical protein